MQKTICDQKFANCLRIQIFPDSFEKERINNILKFVKKYSFSNVILMFNAEQFNVGHITKDELVPWVKTIKHAKEVFEANNISVSLNPWTEMGHIDRGRSLKKGQNFQTMADKIGNKATLVACPLDKNWENYYLNLLAFYIKEIKPDILWIEDDFRYHNHDPLEWGGCFCPLHLKEFSKRVGYNVTREVFVRKILVKNSRERKAWLEVEQDSLVELASKISNVVKKESPNTSIGLMSSRPDKHCTENRNWDKLLNAFATDGAKINRIHLPCYREITGKEFISEFNKNSMVVRAFCNDDTFVYPELEIGGFTQFTRSPRFFQYSLEGAIPLGLDGMTYDIFDFCGNGTQEKLHYGEVVKSLRCYLSAVKSLNLKVSTLQGLIIPVDEKTAFNLDTNCWDDLITKEFNAISYFSSLGYSFSLSKEKEFKNKTLVLFGQNANNFTDKQLIKLFKNNFVIVDGGAVSALVNRSLGYLINVKNIRRTNVINDKVSFEQSNEIIEGIHNYRMDAGAARSGDYALIEYLDESKMNVVSNAYTFENKIFGPGFSHNENIAILPCYYDDEKTYQFSIMRDEQFFRLSKKFLGEFVKSDYQGVFTYLYKRNNERILILSNATVDTFNDTKFFINGFKFDRISILNRKTGKFVKQNFTVNGNKVTISHPLEYLSTLTLKLE